MNAPPRRDEGPERGDAGAFKVRANQNADNADSIPEQFGFNPGDLVTVIRDPRHPLGKRFTREGKHSAVSVSFGLAVQRHVPTAEAMANVLREVAEDPHAALINSGFAGIPCGEEFVILSEKEIAGRLKLSARADQLGVHTIEHEGRTLKAVGRFKDNTTASRWQLLDRDVDAQTPAQYGVAMDFDAWLAAIDCLLPGVASAPGVRTGSSSSRVLKDGQPVGQGNGHVWVQIANAADVERLRAALIVRAAELSLSWLKLNKHGKAGALTTIIDTSVLIPGRLVFCGRPTATEGLEVIDQEVEIIGGDQPLDTSAVVLPQSDKVREITRKAGVEMAVRQGKGGSLAIDAYDLMSSTEIELEGGEALAVSEALALLESPEDKLRCQTPFRFSESMAGVLRRGYDGRACLFDVGTGTTHWLCTEDYVADDFEDLVAKAAQVRADIELSIEMNDLVGLPPEELLAQVREKLPAADLAAAEADALIARLTAATARTKDEVKEMLGMPARRRFEPIQVGELSQAVKAAYLIKNILPRAELAVLYGASTAGKSFMVLDMCFAIARGVEWRNQRVRQGRVIYICAEGAGGFNKRLCAYEAHYGVALHALPFYAITDTPNFLGEDDKALAVQIKAKGGADIIVVDTFAQVTAGGNENASEDVGKALASCKRLHRETGATILVIHHQGKDATKGARGWSGLRAAVDAELMVECDDKTKMRTLNVTKNKDGADGGMFPFRLQVVPIGVDDDGDVIDSCVIEHTDEMPMTTPEPTGKNERLVFAVIHDLMGLDSTGVLEGAVIAEAVTRMDLPEEGKKDRRRELVRQALNGLTTGERAIFCKEDGYVKPINPI